MAGKQVSVYVSERDTALWRWAEQYAREHRMPTSQLVMMALERYRAEQSPPPER